MLCLLTKPNHRQDSHFHALAADHRHTKSNCRNVSANPGERRQGVSGMPQVMEMQTGGTDSPHSIVPLHQTPKVFRRNGG
jgi:hypothetical protein